MSVVRMSGGGTGDPRDAMGSCIVLHNPHFAVGATQTVRVLPGQQQRAAVVRVAEQACY